MVILCDTRQQAGKHENIERHFQRSGIKTARQALYVGDYTIADDGSRSVDTKQDVLELAHDIMSEDHDRFKRECERAQDAGIKLLVLVEETLPDGGLLNWVSPKDKNGRPRTKISGQALRAALCTMRIKYGVRFRFCDPKQTGRAIVDYLAEGVLPDARA